MYHRLPRTTVLLRGRHRQLRSTQGPLLDPATGELSDRLVRSTVTAVMRCAVEETLPESTMVAALVRLAMHALESDAGWRLGTG